MNAFTQPEKNRGIKSLFCIITAWSNYDITVDLCKVGAIQQLRGQEERGGTERQAVGSVESPTV